MENVIKFRAWDKENKKMFYDIQNQYDWNIVNGENLQSVLDDENYIVMQYTGLNDIDGKEIYEGDSYSIGNFVEKSFGCFNINGDIPLFNIHDEIKIIGNKYENPELKL